MLDVNFLEPERLRAFAAVAETGSFSRAAERLRLAQPTISIQVRRLEESIGYSLLDRKQPAVTLTKAGEAMLGYAYELLEVISRARRHFSQPPLEGSIRLGLVEDFNFTIFPELLRSLREQHQCFEVFVKIGSTTELAALLKENDLDIVLSRRLTGSTDGEYICGQKMIWVAHPSVAGAIGDIVPLISTPPNTILREIIVAALRKAGRRWSIRFEVPNISGLHAAAAAGLGISAFGVGVIPPDLVRVSESAKLPGLPDIEFTLHLNPQSTDAVVHVFADVVRRLAPLIVARLEEQQT